MKKLKQMIVNPLFTGSLIMLVGTNSVNFLAYVYHLFFGRLLGPSLYGELASILSLIGLASALVGFISIVVVRFVAIEDKEGIKKLFYWVNKIGLRVGIAIMVFLFLLSPVLALVLSTSILSSIQIGGIMFFTFFVMIYGAFLQGLLEFKKLVFIGFITWGLRFILGYILFVSGLSLPGIVFSILASTIAAFFISRSFIKVGSSDKGKVEYNKSDELVKYSLPVFVMTLATGSFITTDVVLVRYFLPAVDSGYYAALSTLGKIIIYASAPVSAVMFPLVSKSYASGKRTGKILVFSTLVTALISLGIIFVYKLYPDFAVGVLYGKEYLLISPYLASVGLLFSIYTLDLLLINYHISKSKTLPSAFVLVASIAQIVGIGVFHANILEVISVSITVALTLFLILAVYSFWEFRHRF